MGVNQMQKMKMKSTLLGLVIGLAIGLVLCGALYLLLTKASSPINVNNKEEKIIVSVLNKSIQSGLKITSNDISTKEILKADMPADAVMLNKEATAKIDLSAGTILTSGMLNTTEEKITSDLRQQEYGMITLPTHLKKDDFVDIRLQMPNGGDYIVISKKQVLNCDTSNITLNMYEEEINLMSNAIIEYYVMPGSKLYATIYNEPGIQTAAVGTYVPNESVCNLISKNPNITQYINSGRYSDELRDIRNKNINSALAPYYVDPDGDGSTTALGNIEQNIRQEIQSLKEARQAYFGTLNSTK